MAISRLGFCGPSAAYATFTDKEVATVTDTTGGASGLSAVSALQVMGDEEIEEG